MTKTFRPAPERDIADTSYYHVAINTSYTDIARRFGEAPNVDPDEKTSCEWILECVEYPAELVTIYDWYEPASPKAVPSLVFEWHIGGTSWEITDSFRRWFRNGGGITT